MSDLKKYNDGGYNGGTESTIGEQIVQEAYWRKAIVDAQRDMYFMPLAEVKDMPRNSGKVMKANVYYPILDDRNIADEGINALGVDIDLDPTLFYVYVETAGQNHVLVSDTILDGSGTFTDGSVGANSTGYNSIVDAKIDIAKAVADTDITQAVADTYVVHTGNSNLYAGSRDPGVITNKLPVLAEGAQRVNRVGSTRVVIEGTIEQFGFFTEYTEESLMFDTDAELLMHVTTEMMHAAVEVTEDLLQKDLLNSAISAGVVRYAGDATSMGTISNNDFLLYDDFVQLSIELDLNRTPKHTTILTGSRFFDTKTVNSARFMYVAPEAVPYLEALTDYHSNKALIEVRHYEGQTTTMNGELGTIGSFRIIVNPEMQYWAGAGAAGINIAKNDGTDIDVYPFLVVGDDSFSTIGFMSDGKKKNTKFTIHNLRPGSDSVTRENPYGNMGLMSIRWWYGFLLKRPERLAVMLAALPIDPLKLA